MSTEKRERVGDRIASAAGNAVQLERIAYGLADSIEKLLAERDALRAEVVELRGRMDQIVGLAAIDSPSPPEDTRE